MQAASPETLFSHVTFRLPVLVVICHFNTRTYHSTATTLKHVAPFRSKETIGAQRAQPFLDLHVCCGHK